MTHAIEEEHSLTDLSILPAYFLDQNNETEPVPNNIAEGLVMVLNDPLISRIQEIGDQEIDVDIAGVRDKVHDFEEELSIDIIDVPHRETMLFPTNTSEVPVLEPPTSSVLLRDSGLIDGLTTLDTLVLQQLYSIQLTFADTI